METSPLAQSLVVSHEGHGRFDGTLLPCETTLRPPISDADRIRRVYGVVLQVSTDLPARKPSLVQELKAECKPLARSSDKRSLLQ
jgi:hypothetical protein